MKFEVCVCFFCFFFGGGNRCYAGMCGFKTQFCRVVFMLSVLLLLLLLLFFSFCLCFLPFVKMFSAVSFGPQFISSERFTFRCLPVFKKMKQK